MHADRRWRKTSDGEERTQCMKFKGSGSFSQNMPGPFLTAVTKSLTKSNIKEERFALAHVLEHSLARCGMAGSRLAHRSGE